MVGLIKRFAQVALTRLQMGSPCARMTELYGGGDRREKFFVLPRFQNEIHRPYLDCTNGSLYVAVCCYENDDRNWIDLENLLEPLKPFRPAGDIAGIIHVEQNDINGLVAQNLRNRRRVLLCKHGVRGLLQQQFCSSYHIFVIIDNEDCA